MLQKLKLSLRRWVNRLPESGEKRFMKTLSFRVFVAFIMVCFALILFAAVANELREPSTQQQDSAVLMVIHNLTHARFLDEAIPVLTNLGGTIGIAAITTVSVIMFVFKKQYNQALLVGCGVGGAVVIDLILKSLFGRIRPDLWDRLIIENGYSFPSGHAMASSALAFSLIAALWYTKWRRPSIIFGGLYILFIGFTRLYLGVHYVSDVVGGWLMSLAWVGILFVLMNAHVSTKNT